MTRDQAVAVMQQKLGFRTDLADACILALQLAQQNLEHGREIPWWLESGDQTLTLTANSETVDLPSNFLREYEDDALWRNDSTDSENPWKIMHKKELEFIRQWQPQVGDYPRFYAVVGTKIYCRPVSTQEWTLRFRYYAKAVELTSNVENLWLANLPYLLIGEAGVGLAADLQNEAAKMEFERFRAEGLDRLLTDNVAREMANFQEMMGGDD